MTKITLDSYTNAIKAKYKKEKLGIDNEYLSIPTLAKLRDLCLMKYNKGLTKEDKIIFQKFFEKTLDINKEINKTDIFNCEIKNFKAIESFLLDRNKKTSQLNLNLIAVLINFSPRPFNAFHVIEEDDFEKQDLSTLEIPSVFDVKEQEMQVTSTVKYLENKEIAKPKKKNKTKLIAVLLVVIVFFGSLGYVIKDVFFHENKLMEWKSNHYEVVNDTEVNGFKSFNLICPFDEVKVRMQKIEVNSKTIFFHYDTPLIYYSKYKGNIEYFNQPGEHPVLKKQLRPITQHIINEHILKK